MSFAVSVAIVGGGISGLAAAYRLRQIAPHADITLIESENRLGGKILTQQVDGYVIEGGPDSFLSSKPRGAGLARDLGIDQRLYGTDERWRRTYVMYQGRLHELPQGLSGLVPSRIEPLLASTLFSNEGKARLQQEVHIPARTSDGDESLAHFMERRFGQEVYGRLLEPLMTGIYAGDGRMLSLLATFPQLRSMESEYGSLLRAMGERQHEAPGAAPRPGFLTFPRGMQELPDTLGARLERVRVLTEAPVTSIRRLKLGYAIDMARRSTLQANLVILATPAQAAARLLGEIDPDLSHALSGISAVSTATISLAFRESDVPHPLDGYGYIVPRAEGRAVLACTWTSRKFQHRAPDHHVLLRVFIGRAGQQDALAASDEELLELALSEARESLGVAVAPALQRVFRWPDAMPQYTLGHLDRLVTIEAKLRDLPGLFLAGASYRGVGIPDCVASGETAAERVATHLGAPAPA